MPSGGRWCRVMRGRARLRKISARMPCFAAAGIAKSRAMIFASDNWAGASEKVMAALAEAARRGGPAYGDDLLTKLVDRRFAEIFERKVAVFFVATGTAANALALAAYAQPGGVAFAHREAHVIADEPGSAELFGGVRLVGLAGERRQVRPGDARPGDRALSRRQYPQRPSGRGQPQPSLPSSAPPTRADEIARARRGRQAVAGSRSTWTARVLPARLPASALLRPT